MYGPLPHHPAVTRFLIDLAEVSPPPVAVDVEARRLNIGTCYFQHLLKRDLGETFTVWKTTSSTSFRSEPTA